jgi:hypothetical protein
LQEGYSTTLEQWGGGWDGRGGKGGKGSIAGKSSKNAEWNNDDAMEFDPDQDVRMFSQFERSWPYGHIFSSLFVYLQNKIDVPLASGCLPRLLRKLLHKQKLRDGEFSLQMQWIL